MKELEDRGPSAWWNLNGVFALFGVTLRRLCRGQRAWIGLGTLLIPTGIVVLARARGANLAPDRAEPGLIFVMMAQMLVPLMALGMATGLVQDEVEEQTLTYLLLRPLPRPLIYLTKLAAAMLVSCVLATIAAVAVEVSIYWEDPAGPASIAWNRGLPLAGAFALSLLTYNAVFGLLGLLMKKPQGIGVMYILLLEGLFANIDFVFRRLTILYYSRVLMLRWLGHRRDNLNLDLSVAPSNPECIMALVTAAAVFATIGAVVFAAREFKVKTPETT